MLMSSWKLVVLRLYNHSFGRSPFFAALLRRVLVAVLINRQKSGQKYVASSRFFDIGELS
ncbi:MAG: hypothetical protein ACM3Q1_10490 [Bacteroidales bacterium]